MKHWKLVPLVMAAAGLALCGRGEAKAVKGQLPPDFTGTTLDGKKLTLSDFRGKNPVLLTFYAAVGDSCRKAFPHLKELDEKLGGQGLRIVAVSMDESRDAAAALPKASGARFPVIFDPRGAIAEKYEVQAIPHTVVLDRDGKVQTILIGVNAEALDSAVKQAVQ